MPVARYRLEGSTAIVEMDDGKANALSHAMVDELLDALGRAEREARAVVLAGRPDRFCAGFDLKVMTSGLDAAKALLLRGADLLVRLYGSPLPVVAACTGHALAAGALVLLTADLRVGAQGAFRIGLNEVSIGLPTPVFATELARDRLATADLVRATLLAHVYGPDEAARVGFLDAIVAPTDVVARAVEEAGRLGALSRMAFQGTKQRLRARTIAHVLSTLEEDLRAIRWGE